MTLVKFNRTLRHRGAKYEEGKVYELAENLPTNFVDFWINRKGYGEILETHDGEVLPDPHTPSSPEAKPEAADSHPEQVQASGEAVPPSEPDRPKLKVDKAEKEVVEEAKPAEPEGATLNVTTGEGAGSALLPEHEERQAKKKSK